MMDISTDSIIKRRPGLRNKIIGILIKSKTLRKGNSKITIKNFIFLKRKKPASSTIKISIQQFSTLLDGSLPQIFIKDLSPSVSYTSIDNFVSTHGCYDLL